MNNCIQLENVNKSFKNNHVVKNLTLNIPQGKITGFLGPNGSGKTTSMRMMCGLLEPDSGAGKCCGYDIFSQRKQIKPLIGYMTQHFTLWENMTVRENLLFLARIHRTGKPRQRVEKVITQFGLHTFQHTLTRHLSGGWRQRTSLAASILHDPKIILLDEPTAGVDPSARREFWKILHNLSDDGMTVLVSTHYMDEAERCQYLAWMSYGTLLIAGNAEQIIQAQGLCTFSVKGPDLAKLEYILSEHTSVEQTAIFSNTLYVTSQYPDELSLYLHTLPACYRLEKVDTTLEDSFAHLMNKGKFQ